MKEEFTVGKNNISFIGDNFKEWFAGMEMKDVENPEELFSTPLTRNMNDKEILKGMKPEEVSLGGVIYSINNLLNKNDWYLFYVKDNAGMLRAVSVYWSDGGWYVYAYSVECPSRWHGGRQVFSRNSLKPLSPSPSDSLTLAIDTCKKAGLTVTKIY